MCFNQTNLVKGIFQITYSLHFLLIASDQTKHHDVALRLFRLSPA